jgi:hypothetical protein
MQQNKLTGYKNEDVTMNTAIKNYTQTKEEVIVVAKTTIGRLKYQEMIMILCK